MTYNTSDDQQRAVAETVYHVLAALLKLGQDTKYAGELGQPVFARRSDEIPMRATPILQQRECDFRIGGQLRLNTSIRDEGGQTHFYCWVNGAGDEIYYGSFVEDANALLERLGVLDPQVAPRIRVDRAKIE